MKLSLMQAQKYEDKTKSRYIKYAADNESEPRTIFCGLKTKNIILMKAITVQLIPAIDMKEGQCVRLFKGRFEEKTVYGNDPSAMAAKWQEAGADLIHLVDLDGSLGDSEANRQAIYKIRKKVSAKLQLGGGIRSFEIAEKWFELGLDRLILGTIIFEDQKLLPKLAAKYPGQVLVALDAVGENIKVRGWLDDSGHKLFTVAAELKSQGAAAIIYTDVDRDGTHDGLNLPFTQKVAEISGLPTIASGGISGPLDLEKLKPLEAFGVVGAITGKALYDGRLDYAQGRQILA